MIWDPLMLLAYLAIGAVTGMVLLAGEWWHGHDIILKDAVWLSLVMVAWPLYLVILMAVVVWAVAAALNDQHGDRVIIRGRRIARVLRCLRGDAP